MIPQYPETRKDIVWWHSFAKEWNGVLFFLGIHWTAATDMELFTNIAGSVNIGAYWAGRWFQQYWPPELTNKPIEWKELYVIAMAAHVWGHHWRGKRILFHCNNVAVVAIWESGLRKSLDLMCLVHTLFLLLPVVTSISSSGIYQANLIVLPMLHPVHRCGASGPWPFRQQTTLLLSLPS